MSERRKPTPLELDIASSLEEDHVASLSLSASEVGEVITLLSQNLLEKNGASGITFQDVLVYISNGQAEVHITVSIARPVSATFDISYTLSNSYANPGELRVSDVQVDITAGRLAKLTLKAFNVQKQVVAILENLNATLTENPPPIVAEHGYSFSDVDLTLENDHLAVQLRST